MTALAGTTQPVRLIAIQPDTESRIFDYAASAKTFIAVDIYSTRFSQENSVMDETESCDIGDTQLALWEGN